MEKTENNQTTFTADAKYFAQPYDISARGFFFTDADDYKAKVETCRNDYGQPVEEFEIQFIDGDDLNAALFDALDINQTNIIPFTKKLDEWEEWNKKDLIVAVDLGPMSPPAYWRIRRYVFDLMRPVFAMPFSWRIRWA